MRVNRKAALPLTEVTAEHFSRAVPGDQCHCTLGEATRDNLGAIARSLGLASADPTTIRVFPAEVDGEPCAGVTFTGTTIDGEEVKVRYLLEDAAAFKIANVTDNGATAGMRRQAARRPYQLRASMLRVRALQGGAQRPAHKDTARPEVSMRTRATNAAQDSGTQEQAREVFLRRLADSEAQGRLPFEVTPELREYGLERVRESFAAKGSREGRPVAPVRLHGKRRFYQ